MRLLRQQGLLLQQVQAVRPSSLWPQKNQQLHIKQNGNPTLLLQLTLSRNILRNHKRQIRPPHGGVEKGVNMPNDITDFFSRVAAQNAPREQPAQSTTPIQTSMPRFKELYTEQPRFQQPAQPAQKDGEFESIFDMPAMSDSTPEHNAMFAPNRKLFYESFAREFNSRRFTGLADYENWLKNLPGAGQNTLSYVQEIGEKYMPTAARQEYELKQQDKAARQKIRMQVSQMKAFDDEIRKNNLPFYMAADSKGNIIPKPINDASTQKANDSRLKMLIGLRDNAMKPDERAYLQEQIDTLIQGRESATEATSPVSGASGGMTREAFIQGFTAKKGYPPTEAMIQKVIARGLVR